MPGRKKPCAGPHYISAGKGRLGFISLRKIFKNFWRSIREMLGPPAGPASALKNGSPEMAGSPIVMAPALW